MSNIKAPTLWPAFTASGPFDSLSVSPSNLHKFGPVVTQQYEPTSSPIVASASLVPSLNSRGPSSTQTSEVPQTTFDAADTTSTSAMPIATPQTEPTSYPAVASATSMPTHLSQRTNPVDFSPPSVDLGIITEAPSAAPIGPSRSPTICIEEATEVKKSVLPGGQGDYKVNPIVILQQGGSSVTFKIEQSWVEWELAVLTVHYEPADRSSSRVCHSSNQVGGGRSIGSHRAHCRNGAATVDVFAQDCSLDVPKASLPDMCKQWHDDDKTASFQFSIPCDPVPEPSDCNSASCSPEARMEHASIEDGMTGRPVSNPVNILHFGNSSVDFQVDQTWKDGRVDWLSVQYTASDDSDEKTCMSRNNVDLKEPTGILTAQCDEEGFAMIDIFVHDSSLSYLETGIEVPATCKQWDSDEMTAAFRYSVPCSRTSESYCAGEPKCLKEAREDWKSVESGGLGDFESSPVTILEQFGSTVEFQIDQTWNPDGAIGWIAVQYSPEDSNYPVCDSVDYIQSGDSSPTYKAACVGGVAELDVYVQDCSFVGLADLDIPETCAPPPVTGRKASFHFTLPCSCVEDMGRLPLAQSSSPTASPTSSPTTEAQVQGDKRTAHKESAQHGGNNNTIITIAPVSMHPGGLPTEAPTVDPIPLATNAVECSKDIFEDYEAPGQSDSWNHGSEYDDENFSTFLGRLGHDHTTVSKTFTIPEQAESLQISFDFYDIDGMPSTDRILMGIQGSYLDLQLFSSNGEKKYYNDIEVTREATTSRQISFRVNDYDTIYSVKMKIPKYWYIDHGYELPISFRIQTDQEIFTESYGIDNLRIHPVCAEDGTTNRNLVTKEPDEFGEDGSYYCSAQDFPCDDNNDALVYVCHYSARLGYQTFCVPEPDSEVLRFYKNDYCGPCVGGFAQGHI